MARPKREQRFKLSRYRYSSGKQSWRVSGTSISGQRVRENFSSKADALERMSVLEHESNPLSTTVAPTLQRTALTAEQIADAESAIAILQGPSLAVVAASFRRWEDQCQEIGLTIDEALAFCSSRYHPELKEISILEARDLFLASRRNVRPKTRKHYESATLRLLKPNPNKLAHQFTVGDLEAILNPFSNPNSYRTYRRSFSTFFRWARKKRFCAENPCERLDLPPADSTQVVVLRLPEVKRLLRAAMAYHHGVMVAPLAIALFAGLRPSEIEDLKPENVTLEKIRVTGGKLRRELKRSVPVSENLAAWLKAYPFNGLPKNFSGKLRALRKTVRPTKWAQDVLRHTSISFQLERDKNEALTAFNNGTSAKMINFHYRDVIEDEKEVADFWSSDPNKIGQEPLPELLPKASTVRWPSNAELRELVWSKPLVHAAKDIGVSDVALRKRCVALGIALPARGHWIKSA